jgi:hypothetical protein
MSKKTACGICGTEFPSLLELSKHDCKMPLDKAYERAVINGSESIQELISAAKIALGYMIGENMTKTSAFILLNKAVDKVEGKE